MLNVLYLQDVDDYTAPVLGAKYTAPLNLLNDMTRDDKVNTV